MDSLAERLVFARTSSGFQKVAPVAERAQVSASALYQLESGKSRSLSADLAVRLAKLYPGFTVEWLVTGDAGQRLRVGEPSPQSYATRIPSERLASSIRLMRLACKNLGLPFDPEEASDAALVLLAVDFLEARGEAAVTIDNVVDFTQRLREKMHAEDAPSASEHGGARRSAGR